MSIQAIGWVLEHSSTTGSERLVLIAIANHVGANGWCWPSIPAIAKEARLDKRTVYRAIDSLEEGGDLVIQRRPGKVSLYGIRGVLGGDSLTPLGGDSSPQRGDISSQRGDSSPPEPSRTIKNQKPRACAGGASPLSAADRKRGAQFMRELRQKPPAKDSQ